MRNRSVGVSGLEIGCVLRDTTVLSHADTCLVGIKVLVGVVVVAVVLVVQCCSFILVLLSLSAVGLTCDFDLFSPFLCIVSFTQNICGSEWPFCGDVPLRDYSLTLLA